MIQYQDDPPAPPVVFTPKKPRCLNCGRETTLDAWDHAAPCGWACDRIPTTVDTENSHVE